MRTDLMFIIPQEMDHVFISNQLRLALETELDKLFDKNVFGRYKTENLKKMREFKDGKQLHDYIFDTWSVSYTLNGKLLTGIKNWFNMRDRDRQWIILKFKKLYYKSIASNELVPSKFLNIIFCKFLVNELLQTLSEPKWQLTTDQVLNN